MSNNIIANIKSQLAEIPRGVDDDTRAVAGASGNKRISIKGGVFRKMVGNKQALAIPDRSMNVVFVKMAHNPSRTYYKGAYKDGDKTPPACWSGDSKVPDPEVKTPMAASCDKCPMSVRGSGRDGQGTACRLSWRTAVVLPGDVGGDVMQLVLPAKSVFGKEQGGKWPFRAYIQKLADNDISAGRVITKMEFDVNESAPTLLFSPVGVVSEDDVEVIRQQRESKAAENAVKLTVYQHDEEGAEAKSDDEGGGEGDATATPEEPRLREPKKAEPAKATDVSDVVKKWAKK